MINDQTVFVLGAEQDHLDVLGDGDGVAGRPVEEIVAFDDFLGAIGVSDREGALNQVAPMR